MTPERVRLALPLTEMAREVGEQAATHDALSAAVGQGARRCAEEGSAAAALCLDVLAARLAWHAQLFAGLVPRLSGDDPGAYLVLPDRGTGWIRLLDDAPGASDRLTLLAAEVLPALMERHRAYLGRAAPVTDAPVIRVVTLAVADLSEQIAELERTITAERP